MRTNRLIALAALALSLGTAASAQAETVAAAWQQHEVRFYYAGFTSDYTCDGIRGQLKELLRTAGARPDIRVDGGCGGDFNQPQPFHNLKLTFSVPVPAEGGGSPGETFPAEWREVRISPRQPHGVDWGDCELVEQFADQVLPELHPRQVDDAVACVPHQNTPGQPDLRVTLLVPVTAPTGTH